MAPVDVTVIILTRDEEVHLERCIKSVLGFASRIVVVDSYSEDATVEIAQELGADVVQRRFKNQADQLNWALDNVHIESAWTMRLDADEYITEELASEISRRVPALSPHLAGILLRRRVVFLGRWIRHGGVYPTKLLRIWRTGSAKAEERLMDEHILVEGDVVTFDNDIVDENLKSLTWWTSKHNSYATREAVQLLTESVSGSVYAGSSDSRLLGLRRRLYRALPLGVRSVAYFAYRYLIRGGFLDGLPGLFFHGLQGGWYRLLVDAKLYEAKVRA